jgi:hypothetical protein
MMCMRRLLIALAVLLATLVLGVAGWWWVRVHPWRVMPDDLDRIDERWEAVETWATTGERCKGDSSLLLEAIEAREEPDRALDLLLQWDERGQGLDPHDLDERGYDFDPLEFARAAVRSAERRDQAYEAVLRWSWHERECGEFLHHMRGMYLAKLAVEETKKRGEAPTEGFATHRPTGTQLFGALAREAWMTPEWVDGMLTLARRSPVIMTDIPMYIRKLTPLEREQALARQYLGDRLHAAATDPDDLDHLVSALAFDPDELPRSLYLEMWLSGLHGRAEEAAVEIRAYDEYLGSVQPRGDLP